MYICLCHAVTDKEINTAINHGVDTVDELKKQLKVSTQCGGCLPQVEHIVDKHHSKVASTCDSNTSSISSLVKGTVNIFMPQDYAAG